MRVPKQLAHAEEHYGFGINDNSRRNTATAFHSCQTNYMRRPRGHAIGVFPYAATGVERTGISGLVQIKVTVFPATPATTGFTPVER